MDIRAYLTKDYVTNLVKEGKRVDGRGFDDRREVKIEKGYVGEKADGSALVHLGDTKVLAGVSMDVGTPYPDRPTSGVMTTSAELRPMADPMFESGPPRENAVELARVVDRGIRESQCIDLEKLYIEEDKVWMAFLDIHMLDNCGNLLDASALAVIAALRNAKIPKFEDGMVVRGESAGEIPLTCTPIPTTMAKIGGKIVMDPDLDEEYAMDARITATTAGDNLHAMQKGGEGRFTVEEAEQVVDKAFAEYKRLVSLVEE